MKAYFMIPVRSLQPIIMRESPLQMRDEIGLTKRELRDIPEQNSTVKAWQLVDF